MKFLRGFCMIWATIALLPLIMLLEIIYLVYVVYTCMRINETRRAFEIWCRCLLVGINMKLDFIRNGL